jgi:hypothetical protein
LTVEISSGDWLAHLVDEELSGHDPDAVRASLPPEVRETAGLGLDARARTLAIRSMRQRPEPAVVPTAREAFRARVAGHVQLALELAVLAGAPFERRRRRAELACLLAAVEGELPQALAADPGGRRHAEAAVPRALAAAGYAFVEDGFPPGDPGEGLPLSEGLLWIERRLAARLAAGYWRRGRLDEAETRRRIDQAARDRAFLVAALAGHAAAGGALHAHRRKVVRHQIVRLRMPRELERRLRDELRAPRAPADLLRAAPRRLRAFLAEQVLYAQAASRAATPEQAAFAERFALEAGLAPEAIPALRAEAARAASRQRWLDGALEWVPGELQGLPADWGDAADELMEKVTDLFTDNLEAIAREVRQTGELGQLLAKAAAGTALTAPERKKVKSQLVDLARVVPALAIFAAPGGMLLLPLLAKLLPFKVLPSAWDPRVVKRGAPARKKSGAR